MNESFVLDATICFNEELENPYVVRATNERYSVLTRRTSSCDAELLESHELPADTDEVVYTIVDAVTMNRGPNDFVFNPYDYGIKEGCEECLQDLESGSCRLSQRHQIPIVLVASQGESHSVQRKEADIGT